MLNMRFAILLTLAGTIAAPAFGAVQKIRFIIHVPSGGPPEDSIYLAGSLTEVGAWKPDGIKFTRQADGAYSADITLPAGQSLEYKITRGTWGTVEKNADGSDRPNRTAAIDANTHQVEITVDRWASGAPVIPIPSTVVGNLKLHKLDSRALNKSRTIRVWLPPGYDANSDARYPVLYMHDGQNCFDRATSVFGNEWQIDETLTKLINEKRVPLIIVVGIDNGGRNRLNELTYEADATHRGGQGAAYADFLLNEVKPLVDKTYRTKPDQAHTVLGGSSLGGLASLDIARRHPNTFAGIIAMSPTLHWADNVILKEIDKSPGGIAGAHIWIDMGTREGGPNPKPGTPEQNDLYVARIRALDESLTRHHIDHRLLVDDERPEHNEPAWAARFPQAITYLLNAKWSQSWRGNRYSQPRRNSHVFTTCVSPM
jgi:predicted alpha/beta superfamily hydrolase